MQYEIQYSVGDHWHSVVGSNALLQDLCMGEHQRMKQIQKAGKLSPKEEAEMFPHGLDRRPPLAHGELKGVPLRFSGPRPPFSLAHKEAA